MKRFGVMLDASRNAVMKVSEVKKIVKVLKSFGYNTLMLYTEETYEVENEPYFGYMRGRYSCEELKEIVNYCNESGIEVIPCFQTLAHLNIFRWAPYSPINDCNDILLAGSDRAYELIENIFKTLRKCFTSEYAHIGFDEAMMVGLGKYLRQNGFQNRFEIISNHLKRVIEIAKKYNFKPLIWSDMYFRLANDLEYYPPEPVLTDEVKALIPSEVTLVYWDYYHKGQDYYEKMFKAHKINENGVWFAGGAWTWNGFTGSNKESIDTMLPAIKGAINQNVENVIITMWGDNGKECSFYQVLPSLYAIKRFSEGEFNLELIKKEFNEKTGEDFDAMFSFDDINSVESNVGGKDWNCNNPGKYMLYSDPFLGFLDSTIGQDCQKYYEDLSIRYENYAKQSKNYAYIFERHSKLAKVLSIKYNLGVKTRTAYQSGDKEGLKALIPNYEKLVIYVEEFHKAFSNLWYKENKGNGFEVHDIRLGGLIQRIKSCKTRLELYLDGKIDKIEELEDKLLDYFGNGDNYKKETTYFNKWHLNSSPNII